MSYVAKINRTYSFKGQIVLLEIGKDVDVSFVKLFSSNAQNELFDVIPEPEIKQGKGKNKKADPEPEPEIKVEVEPEL